MKNENNLIDQSMVSNEILKKMTRLFENYTFESISKSIFIINSYLPNRNLLDLYITLNYAFKIVRKEGTKKIENYKDFVLFANEIKKHYKKNIMNSDIQVHDLGEIEILYNNNFYKILVGNGFNFSFIFHLFIEQIAKDVKIVNEVEELLLFNDQIINDIQKGFDGKIEINNHDLIIPSKKHFNHIFNIYDNHREKISDLKTSSYFLNENNPNKIHIIQKNDSNYLLFNPAIIIDYICYHLNQLNDEKINKIVNSTIEKYLIESFELSAGQNHMLYSALIMDDPRKEPIINSIVTALLKNRIVIIINEKNIDKELIEKQINLIHKEGRLNILAYFSGKFKVYPIEKNIKVEYIYINNHINIDKPMIYEFNPKKSMTFSALDFLYFIIRSNTFEDIIDFINNFQMNPQHFISYDGFSGYFEFMATQNSYFETGAINYGSMYIELYTPENVILELYKDDFKSLPKISNDYLFNNPFMWETREYKNSFIYAKRKGANLAGIVRNNEDKGYFFICRNSIHFRDKEELKTEINFINSIDFLLSFMIESLWKVLDSIGLLEKRVQIFIIPYSQKEKHNVGFAGYEGNYLSGDIQISENSYNARISIDGEKFFNEVFKSKDREIECELITEIFNVLETPDIVFDELYNEINNQKDKPKITDVNLIEIPYYKNIGNISYWPKKRDFILVREEIAKLCKSSNIIPGEYRLEKAKDIIRKLQTTLIPNFKNKVKQFYFLDLHVVLLSLLSALQYEVYISQKMIYSDEGYIKEEISKANREKNIAKREDTKSKIRYLLYLMEFNLKYGGREKTSNKLTSKTINELLAYADWFVVLQDNADTFHWKMDSSSIEITYQYLVNTNFSDDTLEKYKKLTERIYNTSTFISDKIPYVFKNNELLNAFVLDFGFSFDSFVKVLGILSDNGDQKEYREILPDVVLFKSEELVDIIVKEIPELNTKEQALKVLQSLSIDIDKLSYTFSEKEVKDHKTIPIWEREYRPNRFELKPLLLNDNNYIFSPIICYQTLLLWYDSFTALFPVHRYKISNVLAEIDRLKKITQDDMVIEIYKNFKENGYNNVFKELHLHKIGNHPEELGDYDILVFDDENNIIWNIESKVIQLVGSISKFAKQQNTFFDSHENDKKFQKRIDYLTANVDEISKDLNITFISNPIIKSIMVTNKVFVPEFKEIKFKILAYNELLNMI